MNSPLLGSVIVETLIASGVTDIVLSPGSRNAPISLASHAADRDGRIRLHVRVDERVAAFTALGLAKASGKVCAVVTTSGTAVANLAPAAMEARASGVALLLITSDRPSQMIGTGANQTAEQLGVLGPSTVGVVRVASTSGDERSWSAAIQRGHAQALGTRTRRPGPVQVNVEFATPLVATVPEVEVDPAKVVPSSGGTVTRLDGRPTVVLVGDAPPQVGQRARLAAEQSGAPLLAEPSSNARGGKNAIDVYRLLLEQPIGQQIERVVCFGHPTLSRPVGRLVSRDDIELVVVADRADWFDPGHRAATITDGVVIEPQANTWLTAWQRAAARARPLGTPGFDGRGIAAAVLAAVDPEEALFFGSSQTIRDADLAPIGELPAEVWSNRGVSGIDGTVATATGVALATGRPTTVLLGDLTCQHDLGALVLGPLEPAADVRLVIVHDDGGAIFHTLEQGAPEFSDAFERVFGTPQDLNLAAVGRALGWQVFEPSSLTELDEVLQGTVSGRQMVVCSVSRSHRRAEAAQARREIFEPG